jgi:hypothetical protein
MGRCTCGSWMLSRVVLDRTMLLRGNGISAGHLTPWL